MDEISAALANPRPAPQLAEVGETDVAVNEGARRERPMLDPSCPVKPLGIQSDLSGSQRCYYLDIRGQLVGLEAGNRHGKNALIALFGEYSTWLEEHFPQWSKPVYEGRGKERICVRESEIVGFDQAEASQTMIEACVKRGIFDPAGRMRGRGAHKAEHGGIVLHFGHRVLLSTHKVDGGHKGFRWAEPDVHDGFVYTASMGNPLPWHEEVDTTPGERLYGLLRTWRWRRGRLDALLLLGWIGCGYVGGALQWRPNIWLTGGAGTGKSTLNGKDSVLHQLFGSALFRTANTTAAGIRQSLKNSTVPVLLDEIEATADNHKVNEVLDLARISSSGDDMHRGGQDHQAHNFTLTSCFGFSSINIPPLKTSDRTRLGILSLEPFSSTDRKPDLDSYRLPEMGRKLLKRMIDGWPRYAPTLSRFQNGLALAGHNPRGCDQYGALLTGAWILMHDDVPSDEEVADWAGMCAADKMIEITETVPDHQLCLDRLLTSMVQARGGEEREALGSWVGAAVLALKAAEAGAFDADKKADKRLQEMGLKLVNAEWNTDGRSGRWGAKAMSLDKPAFLAVAGAHQGLSPVYQNSDWGGIWRSTMSRFDGAIDPVKVKFGALSLTSVLIPLHHVLEASEVPPASSAEAYADWVMEQREIGASINGMRM